MSDKDDLKIGIEELGKARKDKVTRLDEGVKRVLANRRKARESQSRPG